MADHEYTLKFKVEGQDDIDKAKHSIDELSDKQVNVTVETDDKDLDETKDKLDELGDSDTTAEVKVEADTTQADETIEVLGEIDATDVTANAEVSSDTTGAEEVVTAIEEVDGSEGTGEANTKSDLTGVDEAEQKLNEFDGSTATGEANVDSDTSDLENGVSRSKGMLGNLTNGKYIVNIDADTTKVDSKVATINQKMISVMRRKMSGDISSEYSTMFKSIGEQLELDYAGMYDLINKSTPKIDSAMKKGLNEAFNTNKLTRIKEFGSSINSTVSSTFQGIISNASKGNIGGVLKSISTGFSNIGTSAQSIYGASSTVAKLSTSVGALVGKFIGVGTAIATATRFLTPFAQEGKKIAGLSDQLGMTAEAFQEMSIIGEKFGVSSDVMSSAVQRMFKNIENESPKAVASIEQLGISFDQFKNMSTEEQLKAVGEGLSKVTDASKRSAIAQNIFGASGKKMIKTCIEMANASDNLADSLIGQVRYTEEGTQRSKGFMNALTEMKNRFKALITPITTAVMPAFTGLFDLISGGVAIIRPVLDPVVSFIGELVQVVGEFASGVGQIFQVVGDALLTVEQKIANSKLISGFLKIGEEMATNMSKGVKSFADAFKIEMDGAKKSTDKAKDSQEEYNDEIGDADYSSVEDGTEKIEEQADKWRKNSDAYKLYQGLLDDNVGKQTVSLGLSDMDTLIDNEINAVKSKRKNLEVAVADVTKNIQKEFDSNKQILMEQWEVGELNEEQFLTSLDELIVGTQSRVDSTKSELEELTGEEVNIDIKTNVAEITPEMREAKATIEELPEDKQVTVKEKVVGGKDVEDAVKEVKDLPHTRDVNIKAETDEFKHGMEVVNNVNLIDKTQVVKIDQDIYDENLELVKEKTNGWVTEEPVKTIKISQNGLSGIKTDIYNYCSKPASKTITIKRQYVDYGKNESKDNSAWVGGHAKATARPYRYNTPTIVEVGEYQEEVILGTNIYEQALKNAMGSGVEQGAMMTANNLGNVASGVDSTLLHNDLTTLISLVRTMDAGNTNQVVNIVNGGKVSTNNVGSKTSLISETLRNVGNKNAGITSHDKMVIEALLREIL